jgi:NADH-quinone oxidoreductase subunit E
MVRNSRRRSPSRRKRRACANDHRPLSARAARERGDAVARSRAASRTAAGCRAAAIEYVAAYLDLAPIRVYEVATFYTMYNLKPVGRHHVQVCTNLSCMLRGAEDIVRACRELGSRSRSAGQRRTGCSRSTEAECLGACVNAPMMQIGDDYYEDLSPETTKQILGELKAGGTPKTGSQIGPGVASRPGGLTTLTTIAQPPRKRNTPPERAEKESTDAARPGSHFHQHVWLRAEFAGRGPLARRLGWNAGDDRKGPRVRSSRK